jgi:hypothetical protein
MKIQIINIAHGNITFIVNGKVWHMPASQAGVRGGGR